MAGKYELEIMSGMAIFMLFPPWDWSDHKMNGITATGRIC